MLYVSESVPSREVPDDCERDGEPLLRFLEREGLGDGGSAAEARSSWGFRKLAKGERFMATGRKPRNVWEKAVQCVVSWSYPGA